MKIKNFVRTKTLGQICSDDYISNLYCTPTILGERHCYNKKIIRLLPITKLKYNVKGKIQKPKVL